MPRDLRSEVTFKTSRLKLLALSIPYLGFLGFGFFLIFFELNDEPVWLISLPLFFIVYTLLNLAGIFLSIFSKDEELIINNRGFKYSEFSEKFIEWNEVKNIKIYFTRAGRFICVIFKNPNRYISPSPTLNIFSLGLGFSSFYSFPHPIRTLSLNSTAFKIETAFKQFFPGEVTDNL